jgi:hypothetical protein
MSCDLGDSDLKLAVALRPSRPFAVQRFGSDFPISRSTDLPLPLPWSYQVGVGFSYTHPKSSQIGVHFSARTSIGVHFNAFRCPDFPISRFPDSRSVLVFRCPDFPIPDPFRFPDVRIPRFLIHAHPC